MLTFLQFVESNQEPTGQTAIEFGWINPRGKAIIGIKPSNRKSFGHYDMTTSRKYNLPPWHSIFYDGYVRYSIGKDGSATFNYHPSYDAKRNMIEFMLANHSRITGAVFMDPSGPQSGLRKQLTRYSSPHEAMIELESEL
jgi:hypothetical protein